MTHAPTGAIYLIARLRPHNHRGTALQDLGNIELNKAAQLQKLAIEDHDLIVIRYNRQPSRGEMEGAARIARELFPRNKTLILDSAVDLSTLSPAQLAAAGLKRID
ncbi:MAG TPA: hypothetical protein VFL54_07725 [Gammaproteobacteria bacterium]|nr:hypothetical protein [Gammaproteobacteria bacterium]